MAKFQPGACVTVDYRAGHTGIVLAVNDPRAWEGSIAFGGGLPTVAQVDAHLANPRISPFVKDIPVLWSFGKVYWTEASKLRRFERVCRQGLCSGVVPNGKHDSDCLADNGDD